MKIVKKSEARLEINLRLLTNVEENNAKSGVKECKFTVNLKSLIARFSSEMAHNFLLNVHWCRFGNLSISISSYKNNMLKVSH